MKRNLCFVFALCLAGMSASASTCETRVDAHQKASTPKRVEYCLTQEEIAEVQKPTAQVIYSSVSTNEPAPSAQVTTSGSGGYFHGDKYEITRGYVETTQFPEFQNEFPSEQMRQAQRQELSLPSYDNTPVANSVPTSAVVKKSKPEVLQTETKAGIRRRQSKPSRFMKQTFEEQSAVSESETVLPMASSEVSGNEEPNLTDDNVMPQQSYYDMTDNEETIPYGVN